MIRSLSEFISANSIKGFLADDEGEALFRLAQSITGVGPCLEIGSYCGKSTVYIGAACKQTGNILFSVDHHRGSEEHQPGEEYHDVDLLNENKISVNSFPMFQRTLRLAALEENVIPIVTDSRLLARHWRMPLGMVFIDGGHSHESAMHDCVEWSKHIPPGGILAVHDIFPDPQSGGQGPYLAFTKIAAFSEWVFYDQINSLGILRRNKIHP